VRGWRGGVLKKGVLFLKKRTRKLCHLGPEGAAPPRPNSKSFLLLFFKKEALT
jgi:hypothetical protein